MASPDILDERETLARLLARGAGLARFGDGELAIALMHRDAPGQVYDASLAKKLRMVLTDPLPNLIVALPRVFHAKPATDSWAKWRHRMELHAIIHAGQTYGSAFVTRPDYYKLDTWPADYWHLMRELWDGRPVLLVRGDAAVPELYDNASEVRVMTGPSRDAWNEYGALLSSIVTKVERGGLVVMQHGPTATVLAYDLAKQGIQALDMGKASRYYHRFVKGDPDA